MDFWSIRAVVYFASDAVEVHGCYMASEKRFGYRDNGGKRAIGSRNMADINISS
jgi:hypothetical protein